MVLILGMGVLGMVLAMTRITLSSNLQSSLQSESELLQTHTEYQARLGGTLLPQVLNAAGNAAASTVDPASLRATLNGNRLCWRSTPTTTGRADILSAARSEHRFMFTAQLCGHDLGTGERAHLNSATTVTHGSFQETRLPLVYSTVQQLQNSAVGDEHREQGVLTLRRGAAPLTTYAVATRELLGPLGGIVDGPVWVGGEVRATAQTSFLNTVATNAAGFEVDGRAVSSTLNLGLPCSGVGCPSFARGLIRGQNLDLGLFSWGAQGTQVAMGANVDLILRADATTTHAHVCETGLSTCTLYRIQGGQGQIHTITVPRPPAQGAVNLPDNNWQALPGAFGGFQSPGTVRVRGTYRGNFAVGGSTLALENVTAWDPPCTTQATPTAPAQCNTASTDLLTAMGGNITLSGALNHAALYTPTGQVSASNTTVLVGAVIARRYQPAFIVLTHDPRGMRGLAAPGLPRSTDWPPALGFVSGENR